MLLPVISGLVVSIDAFFIGLSLGLQKKCKFLYLATINAFLFFLCMLGFFFAEKISIPFEPDLIVGFSFITLGSWTVLQFFIFDANKPRKKTTLVLVGIVMSCEAMLITMGITFIFLPDATIIIPITVALAHFGYSALSFFMSRIKFMRRIPPAINHIISGLALITYGLFALFL